MTSGGGAIIAVDPGREKCGLAVLRTDGEVLAREVVSVADLSIRAREMCDRYDAKMLVLGTGTGHAIIKDALIGVLDARSVEILDIPEVGTTIAARKLYFRHNPPRGWLRMLPEGLRVPRETMDGYAAEAIGRRYLGLD